MNTSRFQPHTLPRMGALAAALALAAGLAACNKTEEPTAGQRLDSAIEKTEQAAQEAKQKMESAAHEAGDATRSAAKVSAGLAQDPDLSAIKIDVDTRAGVVTLNGPVKTEQARERATQIAQGVQGVNSVVNNLTISSGG
jgi:osmotically-inducible protein OsmY